MGGAPLAGCPAHATRGCFANGLCFEFGGATVILVFQAGKITIDGDLNLAMNLPKLMKLAQ